jgi:hypothetical protein
LLTGCSRATPKRIGQLIVVSYDDLKRVLTEGVEVRTQIEAAVRDEPARRPEVAPMSIEAAHAYLQAARSPTERRSRKNEIEQLAAALNERHSKKLRDGSTNPRFDPQQLEHASALLLTAAGGVATRGPHVVKPTPILGGLGRCTWCERPAYATKQRWTGDGWSGAPVCEVCARKRATNERVVQIDTRTILLPARDPSVPKEYAAPRRQRRPKPTSGKA